MKDLKDYVRTIPNFPKEGIMFRDVSSVLQDKEGLKMAIVKLVERLGGVVVKISCLMELPDLKGREKLSKYDISTNIIFEGE